MSFEESDFYQDRRQRSTRILEVLSKNPDGLTPDEVCQAFPYSRGRIATLNALLWLRKRCLVFTVVTVTADGESEKRIVAASQVSWAV
jgi:hypothetical protein